jgi:steroid delta-isomerase-like uncharacterized protein
MSNLQKALAWINWMDEHDVDKMFSLCREDMIGEEVAEGRPNVGRDAVAASYVDLFGGFPDCRSDIINEFAGGDQALVEVRWMGTNTGPFRGAPATGKRVDVKIAYIFKFDNQGQISLITEYYDGATVGAQMS